jgi:4-amino-4-deoxy-L-arabinose transferase-like glycosyltransferase
VYKAADLFTQKHTVVDLNLKRIQMLFRLLAIGLGVLHVYAAITSQSMNADGVSYLDIGDAYFHADWVNAINPVWSPLYSWILGFANFVIQPSVSWEFPVVHLVNFIIYVIALSSFEFMWSSVRTFEASNESYAMPDAWWWTLGYLLFIWTSLSLIEVWAVTPDMLMATFVLLAAGLIAKVRLGADSLRLFLGLGLVLGLGYLSKTFMFSTALVFLGLAWLVQRWTWASFKKILPAIGVFLLIGLPYVAIISNAKGKLTLGEAGTVTYVRHVIGIPYPHWQGDPVQSIVPSHRSRVIHRSPVVYEFGEPIGGTYPIALDPSYWYEGISAPITLERLVGPLLASGSYYLELFLHRQGALFACVVTLYVMAQKRKRAFSEILRQWALAIPAMIAFGLYALVLVEDRYVGVFVLLLWTDIIANIRLPELPKSNAWLNTLSAVAAFGLLSNIILFNLDGFTRLNPTMNSRFVESSAPPASPVAVALSLHELGVQGGDKVGVIGYAYDSYWARLAKVRITAEMLDADAEELWGGDEALRQSVLQAFASSGIDAVVAEYVPEEVILTGWHRVDETNFYIYVFESNH